MPAYLDVFPIAQAGEPPDDVAHVVRIVIGRSAASPAALFLTVDVSAILFLYLGGILQHQIRQVTGGVRGIHAALESLFAQDRQGA